MTSTTIGQKLNTMFEMTYNLYCDLIKPKLNHYTYDYQEEIDNFIGRCGGFHCNESTYFECGGNQIMHPYSNNMTSIKFIIFEVDENLHCLKDIANIVADEPDTQLLLEQLNEFWNTIPDYDYNDNDECIDN